MEKLLRTKDIMERYSCSANTARKYMREMVHTERPLTVSAAAVAMWDDSRTQAPAGRVLEVVRQINRRSVALPDRFERKRAK